MSRPFLIDVNVLVALFDPHHIHHDAAHEWFADNRDAGWATCPITENGFVHAISHPAYGLGERVESAVGRLRTFCDSGGHQFWRDAISLRDELFDLSRAGGAKQLTDVYLLGLSVYRKGCLATFDRTIPVGAVRQATADSLAVISVG
ncbi:MAG: VapC toxin family PIN domain ribonuclease [Acidobacteriota bacterium]|nr:VapC toxin family PIN domain ribonuclease [Acidobacteriota bacterium]